MMLNEEHSYNSLEFIEDKLENMGFNNIEYYNSNKNSILECEKLTQIDPIHLDSYCLELKTRLQNIKVSKRVDAYVTTGDLKSHLDVSNIDDTKIDTFVTWYQGSYLERKQNHLLRDDIYSVLATYAILFKNIELLKAILNRQHYTNIFTTVNKLGSSPIYDLLTTRSEDLQILVIGYLKDLTNPLPKTTINSEDENIFNILNCPLRSGLDTDMCEELLLQPLFLDQYFEV